MNHEIDTPLPQDLRKLQIVRIEADAFDEGSDIMQARGGFRGPRRIPPGNQQMTTGLRCQGGDDARTEVSVAAKDQNSIGRLPTQGYNSIPDER